MLIEFCLELPLLCAVTSMQMMQAAATVVVVWLAVVACSMLVVLFGPFSTLGTHVWHLVVASGFINCQFQLLLFCLFHSLTHALAAFH
jgi:hypothetical protein